MTYSSSVHRPLPDDASGWRRLAEQLSSALETRVAIEQAKGMLRERLGIEIDVAFELLRTAARHRRMKVQALASEVASSFSTPDAIVEELARRPDRYPVAPAEERALQTEELARRLNAATAESSPEEAGAYVCECANPYCTETLEVSAEDLDALHSRPGFYLVAPGHQIPDFENTVLVSPEFVVVQKPDAVESAPG